MTTNSQNNDSSTYWKRDLMLLQEMAPKPKPVPSKTIVARCPPYYGKEFHGLIPREQADQMLAQAGEGSYLIRESQRLQGSYTLCMRFDGQTLNYRLFFDGMHYVGEKRCETVAQLVADGLICMFMDKKAADYINRMTDEANYDQAPYQQYQRRAQRRNNNAETQNHHKSSLGSTTTPPDHRLSTQNHQFPPINKPIPETPAKSHRFKSHTFKAHFCDYCGNFMWGLVQQGLRCEDCGFAAHKKCSEKTRMDCQPDLKYVKRMFSVDLGTLCMAHGTDVPPVIEQCVQQVEARGLFVEGIYRISGSHEDIEHMRIMFDMATKPVDLSANNVEDIHSVAGLLKLYLRQLPQPLVTYSCYASLSDILRRQSRNEYDRCKQIRAALDQLPIAHLETLKRLIAHLKTVAEHSAVNKMTVENLATVFAPTVLCHTTPQNMSMALPQQEQFVMQYLIVNGDKLFSKL